MCSLCFPESPKAPTQCVGQLALYMGEVQRRQASAGKADNLALSAKGSNKGGGRGKPMLAGAGRGRGAPLLVCMGGVWAEDLARGAGGAMTLLGVRKVADCQIEN